MMEIGFIWDNVSQTVQLELILQHNLVLACHVTFRVKLVAMHTHVNRAFTAIFFISKIKRSNVYRALTVQIVTSCHCHKIIAKLNAIIKNILN